MASTLATDAEITYEQRLQARLRTAFLEDAQLNNGPGPLGYSARALHDAQVAMSVLAEEVDNAMGWGVDCAACGYYLDRILAQYGAGEEAGVALFTQQLDKILTEARRWTTAEQALDHIEVGMAGFLRSYYAAAPGQTFRTPNPQFPN